MFKGNSLECLIPPALDLAHLAIVLNRINPGCVALCLLISIF